MSNDGVLGPFPGFTVSQERLQLEGISFDDVKRAFADLKTQQQRVDTMLRENDDLTAEVERLHFLLDGKTQYVDCGCSGCPRKVPEAWAAGMCQPCCEADCEHTDGAKAVAAERDDLTAEVERLRGNWKQAERELARVAAVLATTRENVEALVQAVGERYITQAAVCTILAAQRSLAGLVVTP